MKQTDLDQEMVDMGRERYHAKVARATELGIESTHPAGQRLLQHSVINLTQHLNDWIKHAQTSPGKRHRVLPYLVEIPTKVTAALTARATLDAISQGRKLTTTAAMIGGILEDEAKYRTLKDEYTELWAQMNRVLDRYKSAKNKAKFIDKTLKYHNIVLPRWNTEDRIRIGIVCLELMRQATGLIDIVARKNQFGKSIQWVEPTEDLLNWFKGAHSYMEMLEPVFLPTTEKPMPWTNVFIGGYHSDIIRRRPMIKTTDKTHLDTAAVADMPKVYRAVNAIQSTPFKVNPFVLNVMEHCWKNSIEIDGLVSSEDEPLPPKPHDIKTNADARKDWRRRAARQHFDNERKRSKRLHALRVLNLANKFKDQTHYGPMTLDFRGRGYYQPHFLNPQGPSYVKGLYLFANSVRMNDVGEKWLKIHLANCFGYDKLPYGERIRWAEENQKMICAIGKDPLQNMDWVKADDPWLFLPACNEFYLMHTTGNFYTSLPIGIDATNQGLQIYALSLRDPESAAATNCLPCDRPNDLYQQVADTTIELIKQSPDKYGNDWLSFGLSRKTCKRQTMTLPYGSTFFSCRNYTAEWFYSELKKDRTNPFGNETYHPCNWLAEKIWEAIGKSVSSARTGMDWLQEVAAVCINNDVIPQWTTPLGLPVRMHYEKQEHLNIKTNVFGVVRQTRIRQDSGAPSKRKSVNSIAPNWVHSMDGVAGLVGESVNIALDNSVRDYLTVHDDYEVHAPNVPTMAAAARLATINIFSGNLMQDTHNEIQYLLPSGVDLPEPPPQGDLDVSLVKKAQYYFS